MAGQDDHGNGAWQPIDVANQTSRSTKVRIASVKPDAGSGSRSSSNKRDGL